MDRTKSDTGLCSGRDPFNTLLVDSLAVPDVAPGPYVLSLRWDCEKSAQVCIHSPLLCIRCCVMADVCGKYPFAVTPVVICCAGVCFQ